MRWIHWLYAQMILILPAFIFFLIAFSLINMIEGLFLKAEGIPPFTFYTVVIAAVVVAKVLIVIDHLPWINVFPNKPLIYNIIWKTFLYELSIFIVRIAGRLIPSIMHMRTLSGGYAEFIAGLDVHRLLAIQLCYLLLMLTYVSGSELTRALGSKRMRQLLFGR